MTPNDALMEQCRREAERAYTYPNKEIPDPCNVGRYLMECAFVDQQREAYAAALYAERSKPRTSLSVDEVMDEVRKWYSDPQRAGLGMTMRDNWNMLHARLTAKLNELNTQTNG